MVLGVVVGVVVGVVLPGVLGVVLGVVVGVMAGVVLEEGEEKGFFSSIGDLFLALREAFKIGSLIVYRRTDGKI